MAHPPALADETYCSISRHGTEALGAEITKLSAYIYAATYKLLVLIREFDDLGGWHQCGLTSCAHWLNFKCGIGMNADRQSRYGLAHGKTRSEVPARKAPAGCGSRQCADSRTIPRLPLR